MENENENETNKKLLVWPDIEPSKQNGSIHCETFKNA